jgi:hypothetical protein
MGRPTQGRFQATRARLQGREKEETHSLVSPWSGNHVSGAEAAALTLAKGQC